MRLFWSVRPPLLLFNIRGPRILYQASPVLPLVGPLGQIGPRPPLQKRLPTVFYPGFGASLRSGVLTPLCLIGQSRGKQGMRRILALLLIALFCGLARPVAQPGRSRYKQAFARKMRVRKKGYTRTNYETGTGQGPASVRGARVCRVWSSPGLPGGHPPPPPVLSPRLLGRHETPMLRRRVSPPNIRPRK